MHRISIILISLFLFVVPVQALFAAPPDEESQTVNDTINQSPIVLTSTQASEYISRLMESNNLWRPSGELMRYSIMRLMDQYRDPLDSVVSRINQFSYDTIALNRTFLTQNDTLPLRWLNDSTFIIDTIPLTKEPFVVQKTIVMYAIDTLALPIHERSAEMDTMIRALLQVRDTITDRYIDTLYLNSLRVQMHQVKPEGVVPPLFDASDLRSASLIADSSALVISRSTPAIIAHEQSPFYVVPNVAMPDSLRSAVETLLSYNDTRDSILVFVSSNQGRKTPFWLSSRDDEFYRFWVKNQDNDSITIWIGNPTKYDISLLLEDNVNVQRRQKRLVDDVPITTQQPIRTIARLSPLKEIPVYWKYNLESAFILNQTFFSNWAKGGENSFSSMLDIKSTARYVNTEDKTQWISTGRLKYGSLLTEIDEKYVYRTNADLLEFNSQFNRSMRGKFDFSSSLYFKTQVAKGFKNPGDEIPISKFLNPGTFTVGVGVEYKPVPKTRINFSPLSYRNTFVLDTARINQRTHGIDADKRSRQEMGGQLVINTSMTPLKGLNVTNAIRLFSGYLEKPENVDIDWEMSIDKQISWFFMIKLNFHVIYDDDIRFPVLNAQGEPVKLPDGTNKRVSKMQFKEFLGLTLSFKI